MQTAVSALSWGALGVVLLVGAAWVIKLCLTHPKATIGAAVVYSMISQTVGTVGGISILNYGDELAVVLAVGVACARRLIDHHALRFFAAVWFLLAFILFGLISSVVHAVPWSITLMGSLLYLKGPALGFAVAQLDWRRADLPRIARAGAAVIVVILFTCALNAAAPGPWNDLVSRTDVASERGGFTSLTGPFDHPVGLGTTMALAFLAIYLYRLLVRRTPFTFVLMIATGLACLAAFRRKSIVAGIAVALGVRAVLPLPRALFVTSAVILLPMGLVLLREPLTAVVDGTLTEYLTDWDRVARIRMTIDGFLLAVGAFPLGVGLGRFGSFTASENYSPIYTDLGYERIWGLGQGDMGGFLSDTFWPAPLAETGILGALCYLGALIMFIVPGWRMMRSASDGHSKWIGAVTVAWFAQLLIESVVAPVFLSPPMYGLPFAVAGLCLALGAEPRSGRRALRVRSSQAAEQDASIAKPGRAPWELGAQQQEGVS